MKVKILAFGIAKDVIGARELEMTLEPDTDAGSLKTLLQKQYPALPAFMVAIDAKYASDTQIISEGKDVAIIPPTSGG